MAISRASIKRGIRFVNGVWDLRRHPETLERSQREVREGIEARNRRFTEMMDTLVWPFPDSPTQRLLVAAGVEPGDVKAMVAESDVDATLRRLVDAGVYVGYDEYLGKTPVKRGSLSFDVSPGSFANPLIPADFLATSGGSRSGGTVVGRNFGGIRRSAKLFQMSMGMWGFEGGPVASWFPPLPAAAGLSTVLISMANGYPATRWFSPTPLFLRGEATKKRLANAGLWALGLIPGSQFPRLTSVPAGDVTPVLEWLQTQLGRGSMVFLGGYTTGAVRVAVAATERGISLAGLVLMVTGEPISAERARAINASGAVMMPVYACTPFGYLGTGCPHCPDEETHLWSHHFGLITRPRERPDGRLVDAFCVTPLDPKSSVVGLNMENDDYGGVTVDTTPCECLAGQYGVRHRIHHPRGISKIVTGGSTIPGEVLQSIVDADLPRALGGAPGDYQFSEEEQDSRTVLVLRVHPRLGAVSESEAVRVVQASVDASSPGRLATSVWRSDGGIRVVREMPHATQSGKVLAFEPLRPLGVR